MLKGAHFSSKIKCVSHVRNNCVDVVFRYYIYDKLLKFFKASKYIKNSYDAVV